MNRVVSHWEGKKTVLPQIFFSPSFLLPPYRISPNNEGNDNGVDLIEVAAAAHGSSLEMDR